MPDWDDIKGRWENKTMRQCDARNLTMMMDFYEMTMSNGYFLKDNIDEWVAFDIFYRKNPDGGGFCIFSGLGPLVGYI